MTASRPSWDPTAEIDLLASRLASTKKYRSIHRDTLHDLAAAEAVHAGDARELEKLVRQRLHRAVAPFLVSGTTARLADEIAALPANPRDPELRRWCLRAMATHVSSAERLDDLDGFYGRLLELVGPVTSLADLACAYNPLSIPWLRDCTDARYVGYDFNGAFFDLGRRFAERVDPPSRMVHADVLVTPRCVAEDVALLLKTFHCLEARRRGSGLRLVEDIDVRTVVVSLPTRTRSGRAYGFEAGHGRTIQVRAGELGWRITTAQLRSEELWAIDKGQAR